MKPLAAAALIALLALPAPPIRAQAAQAAPSEALVERFLAALPDHEATGTAAAEIDAAELDRLAALNPGKEARIRSILQANLACTGPALAAGTLRMLRTIARDLGEARLRKLIGFYEGPDFAALSALGARIEGNPTPSAEDSAALARLMETYPLQDFHQQLGRAEEIIAADPGFMSAAVKCAGEQVEAMTAAGLKAN